MQQTRLCIYCRNDFVPNKPTQIYCSKKCQERQGHINRMLRRGKILPPTEDDAIIARKAELARSEWIDPNPFADKELSDTVYGNMVFL